MGSVSATRAYIYFTLLLVFSTFEYFFRSNILLPALSICAIVDVLLSKQRIVYNKYVISLFIAITIINLLQYAFIGNVNINGLIGQPIILYGIFCIANIINWRFSRIFINVITFIAFYSLIIYLFCLIPNIKSFLYDNVASNNSINVAKAVFEGGGRNFIIYNFQTDYIFDSIGFSRNCGPFWEPGMFAVFLITALFFNIFISRQNRNYTIILASCLITTFSTGGFIVALLLFVFYSVNIGFKTKNVLLFIPIAVAAVLYVLELDYVGEKTVGQFNTASVGSDESRYGAFITQKLMIENSPIIGGEEIKDYATTKTLASGTLLPFVKYGIPVGLVYFLFLFKACTNIASWYQQKLYLGVELWILILALSFSQTILLNAITMLMVFNGLILKRQEYV